MKSQLQVYGERLQIRAERKELNKKLETNANNLSNLQEECTHELVLAFDDHKLHKIGPIYNCFCPACGKIISIYQNHEIEKTDFKDSKIIDLTHLPISAFEGYFSSILEYIFNNYDYCYSDDASKEEITENLLNYLNIEVEKKDGKPNSLKMKLENN